jgi:hypothetical protein
VDADHWGFLRHEGLDRVGAHDLRRKVDLQDFDSRDFRHDLHFDAGNGMRIQ